MRYGIKASLGISCVLSLYLELLAQTVWFDFCQSSHLSLKHRQVVTETQILERFNYILLLNGNSILLGDVLNYVTCDEADELSDCHLHKLPSLNAYLLHLLWLSRCPS